MSHTYTTQDGKTAVAVNPYENETGLTNAFKHKSFEAQNPPLPLTTERPDLIGKDFEGEVVNQGRYAFEDWEIIHNSEPRYYTETRQAVQPVPVKELLMPNEYEGISIKDKELYYDQWQRWVGNKGWEDCKEPRIKLTTQHRFVYKLKQHPSVPVKGEEKSKPDNGYEEVDILDKKSYNLGIDAAVKVFRPGMFITQDAYDYSIEQLNQLKK